MEGTKKKPGGQKEGYLRTGPVVHTGQRGQGEKKNFTDF